VAACAALSLRRPADGARRRALFALHIQQDKSSQTHRTPKEGHVVGVLRPCNVLQARGFRTASLAGSLWCNLLIRLSFKSGTHVATHAVQPGILARHENRGARMNWDRIEGNWKQMKGKVKEQWGNLTDDQLDVIAGKRDQLVGKIQEQYGISKDEAEKQVDRFRNSIPDSEFNR
jgi:uncharacterized protein YjbJ (UPF0337 family)